ncbi:IclR family transcriptional regulator [Arthrobacter sp. AZCC_0090]|uniref:IclR family transcriptional regulator n=1 Tax=Arthrobacter sp. AZCC_0090 TaxID=2735881 RepID=UPI001618BD7D|nr:IclR family transcriptional regulator [Arthrobacter sp. AZCC_0090]MBB6406346.1 DNA-binding IclR family transcriptional regulator [Arthrobacter sp. AZCC_0090]
MKTGIASRPSSTVDGQEGIDHPVEDKSVMGRGLSLLEALSRAGRPLSLAELSRETRLPKSTVHRLSAQLVQLRLLDRVADGFCLGLRMFEWGSHAERQRHLRMAAIPFLTEMHSRLRETVHLAVLDGRDIVYIEKIESHRAVHCPTYVGDRKPAHATALGKAMLAFSPREALHTTFNNPLTLSTPRTVITPGMLNQQLQKIRETRVSIEIEESFLGVACVAAPIVDSAGVVLGAISIVTPTFRFDPNKLAPEVRTAARKIAEQLEVSHPAIAY